MLLKAHSAFLVLGLAIFQNATNPAFAGEAIDSQTVTKVPATNPLGQPAANAPDADLQMLRRTEKYKQDWWRTSVSEDYRRFGKTNAAWDSIVFSAIDILSELILHGTINAATTELMQRVGDKADQASRLGCDDPLVKYLKLRYGKGREREKYFSELLWGYLDSAEALDKTGYHPMRKVYANFKACEFSINLNPPEPRTAARANALLRQAIQALQDPRLPLSDASTAADCAV